MLVIIFTLVFDFSILFFGILGICKLIEFFKNRKDD